MGQKTSGDVFRLSILLPSPDYGTISKKLRNVRNAGQKSDQLLELTSVDKEHYRILKSH